jgi:hypothetical protein
VRLARSAFSIEKVCINQNDIYERSQQVQIMRQIYSRATNVVARVGAFGDKFQDRETVEHLSSISKGKKHIEIGAWGALREFFFVFFVFDEMYWKVSSRHNSIQQY